MKCKNCNYEATHNYCPNCGQAVSLKRISREYIVHEVGQVLNFEKGIFYTIRELLIRPGENVRNFIAGDRSRLIKPIIFIIVTSLIYSLINNFFHLEDGYVKFEEAKPSATSLLFKWVQDNYGYANIIMGLFIAFWIKLAFRKYGYNYFEILILLCYVMGTGMLLYAAAAIFQGITHIEIMQAAAMASFVYAAWAIGQFFDKHKFINYVKAFFSYLLGFVTFSFTVILIGILIDTLTKH